MQFSNIFKGVTQEKLDDLVERFQREEFHAGGGPCSPNHCGSHHGGPSGVRHAASWPFIGEVPHAGEQDSSVMSVSPS